MSNGALATSNWIDSFFADDRTEDEESQVRLKVSLQTFVQENDNPTLDARVRLRVRLPRLSERLQLEISGAPGDNDIAEVKTPEQEAVDRFEGTDMQNLAAELRYFVRRTKRANISLSSGLRYRDGSPVLYLGPRYRQSIEIGEWDFSSQQQVRWFTDNGWELRARCEMERTLPWGLFFRTSTGGSWLEPDPSNLLYDFRCVIYQPLSNRRTVAYEWNNFFSIQPGIHLDEINFRIRYRQKIWRDWMYAELAPQVSFPWDGDYEHEFGVLFRIDMFFGNML